MSIRCTGTAAGEFPADTAVLRVQASGRDADPGRAYRTRREARDVALGVIADTTVEVRAEHVRENTWDDVTHSTWECELVATGTYAGLQEILSRLAAVPSVEVTGPDWRLSAVARQAAREGLLAEAVRVASEAEVMIGTGQHARAGRAIHSRQDHRGVQAAMMAPTVNAHPFLDMTMEPQLLELVSR